MKHFSFVKSAFYLAILSFVLYPQGDLHSQTKDAKKQIDTKKVAESKEVKVESHAAQAATLNAPNQDLLDRVQSVELRLAELEKRLKNVEGKMNSLSATIGVIPGGKTDASSWFKDVWSAIGLLKKDVDQLKSR
jgi:chromosome segregation ATPase